MRIIAATVSVVLTMTVMGTVTGAFAQSGDATRGERLFNQQCKACHTVEKDGKNGIGPNLHGLFGQKAGAVQGFQFSEAMQKSGIVWDDKTVGEYLKDPKGRVPDGKMVYAGLKQQSQLDDMLAYLRKATQ
jgi:cytochrome c